MCIRKMKVDGAIHRKTSTDPEEPERYTIFKFHANPLIGFHQIGYLLTTALYEWLTEKPLTIDVLT